MKKTFCIRQVGIILFIYLVFLYAGFSKSYAFDPLTDDISKMITPYPGSKSVVGVLAGSNVWDEKTNTSFELECGKTIHYSFTSHRNGVLGDLCFFIEKPGTKENLKEIGDYYKNQIASSFGYSTNDLYFDRTHLYGEERDFSYAKPNWYRDQKDECYKDEKTGTCKASGVNFQIQSCTVGTYTKDDEMNNFQKECIKNYGREYSNANHIFVHISYDATEEWSDEDYTPPSPIGLDSPIIAKRGNLFSSFFGKIIAFLKSLFK